MKATLLVSQRIVVAPDAFAEVVIWRVPKAVPPSTHAFKYSLAYVVNEKCVFRYDNERGKGDHRHVGSTQKAYTFSTPEKLMADFETDIARWNHEHRRS
jgi:hypothetical protein